MKLSELLTDVITISPEIDRNIQSLTLDSRRVTTGSLFFAIKGTQLDGSRFTRDAVEKGAAAVLVESDVDVEALRKETDTPILAVDDLHAKVSVIAAHFYGQPSKKISLIGVTGTNGKTSCTHFIAQALASQRINCGIIGTLGSGLFGELIETGLTTPDTITLQRSLHDFYNAGATVAAIEVSSHSIDQGRVNELDFNIGVFTNLTQDHLDYHGDMDSYAAVKRHFLADFPVRQLVINIDDTYGAEWAHELAETHTVYTYSTNALHAKQHSLRTPERPLQSIYCESFTLGISGIEARVNTPWGTGDLVLPLVGKFNLSNALAAMAVLCLQGIPFADLLAAMNAIKPVPGRMQLLGGKGKPMVVVDYAHTPDALEKVLQALRSHTRGKLICVFGCGGDRDPGKRPLMAAIVETKADIVVVTNDNPRHESPEAILEDIKKGFVNPALVHVELDRAKAIEMSIQLAGANDCVLIAGKGAEHYQQMGDEKIPFDDITCAMNVLNKNI